MDSILEYKNRIHGFSEKNENRVFMSADEQRALAVFVELFNRAQQRIRLFSGALLNSEVSNDPQFVEAISNFLERKSAKLEVLLNKADEEAMKESPLFKRLAYYQSIGADVVIRKTNKKLIFKRTEQDKKECHFCVCDESSFRLEFDIERRASMCNFNDPVVARKLISLFDEMFPISEMISLTKLNNPVA